MDLQNETAINVAGLLKEAVGSTRSYRLTLDRFPLDDGLAARNARGEVRLTRLRDGIMVRVRVAGVVPLECARCLRQYDQPFAADFREEFRQTVDLRTGLDLAPVGDEDGDTSRIDENHELDLGEVLRQEILVDLPMRADCGADCPGPDAPGDDDAPAVPGDGRLAALAALLGDDDVTEEPAGRGRGR